MIAALVAAKFVLYCGFFWLLALALQVGVPLDSLRAAFHRSWLGAGATIVCLVVYIVLSMSGVSLETNQAVGTGLIWILRAAVWTWVTAHVYRVTRWRKWKLAVFVAIGLALNLGIDLGLQQLEKREPFVPSLGHWRFCLC